MRGFARHRIEELVSLIGVAVLREVTVAESVYSNLGAVIVGSANWSTQ
jgi:hypothetical protein